MDQIAALNERILAQDAKIVSQLEYISVLRQAGRHQVADLAEDTLSAMRKTAEMMKERRWIMENAKR